MEKIIIAEDDPISRIIIAKAVESMGYFAIQTANGAHALELVQSNPEVALVITDISLPDLDGRDFVKSIRANDETKNLPVMIISGVVSYSQIIEVLELGASRFLPKPIDIREVKRLIPKLISGDEFDRGQNPAGKSA
jgi:DNA-binding response OmpR family regulator